VTPDEARRVLGLGPDAVDPEAVRRAYRDAVRTFHPDRPGGDAVRFRRSVAAFELLTVTVDQTVIPVVCTTEATRGPAETPKVGLELLVLGLDRVGEVTYLDRSLALVEGVLPHPCGALQVLIVGGTDGSAQVVDVTNLGGGDAPPPDEIQRLLTAEP